MLSLYQSLTNNKPVGNETVFSDTVKGIGQENPIQLSASQTLAVQQLLGVTVTNRSGDLYSRFIINHRYFSSIQYVRSKKHRNHSITFEHEHFKYGSIIGLLLIKPTCSCNVNNLQYCSYTSYILVLVQPMVECTRPLYSERNVSGIVNSFFLVQVELSGMQIAIYPDQVRRKCIKLVSGRKQYFCLLPYQIDN